VWKKKKLTRRHTRGKKQEIGTNVTQTLTQKGGGLSFCLSPQKKRIEKIFKKNESNFLFFRINVKKKQHVGGFSFSEID
jgi:hypothetical protein